MSCQTLDKKICYDGRMVSSRWEFPCRALPGENTMRKRTRKLRLNRETLLNLDGHPLREVAGGDTQTCPTVTFPCTTPVCSGNPSCRSLCINCPSAILC